ncbi:MAG: hypothetical protein ACLR9W_03100 [Enterobacter hormaechei]
MTDKAQRSQPKQDQQSDIKHRGSLPKIISLLTLRLLQEEVENLYVFA